MTLSHSSNLHGIEWENEYDELREIQEKGIIAYFRAISPTFVWMVWAKPQNSAMEANLQAKI
jgi:hypothetical protein